MSSCHRSYGVARPEVGCRDLATNMEELLQIAESRVTCQLTVEEKECYSVLGLYYSVDVLYAQSIIYLMVTAVHTMRRIIFQRKRTASKTA